MADPETDDAPEIKLSDEDILDSMRHIPGYLDISTEDFRVIYHLAHRHAVGRVFAGVNAGNLMRTVIEPLQPDLALDQAAKRIVASGYKGLPVVDANGEVLGMLTETDFLRRLKADTFLELLLRIIDESPELMHFFHDSAASAVMTAPAVTVARDAGFAAIMKAFQNHEGRSMPVVDGQGRLCGLLLRKDFLSACHAEYLL